MWIRWNDDAADLGRARVRDALAAVGAKTLELDDGIVVLEGEGAWMTTLAQEPAIRAIEHLSTAHELAAQAILARQGEVDRVALARAAKTADPIDACRVRIDAIDDALVALLDARLAVALEIAREKRGRGLAVHVPERERAVLQRVSDARTIAPTAIARTFEAIIAETRRLQVLETDAAAE